MRLLRSLLAGGAAVVGLCGSAWGTEPPVDAPALFARTCAMCHGPDGRAATPAAKRLGIRDLSSLDLSDEQVRAAIVEGRKGTRTVMPAFGSRFSEAELAALVAHLRSLRESENRAKP